MRSGFYDHDDGGETKMLAEKQAGYVVSRPFWMDRFKINKKPPGERSHLFSGIKGFYQLTQSLT